MASVDRADIMKRGLRIAGLVVLFLASFVLFLFLTFPYEVLKEALAAEVSQATGFNVRIGSMSANLPLGITAEDVRIETPNGGASMSLKSASVDIGVLSFLLGRVATDVELEAGLGSIEMDLDFGILDMIQGVVLPKSFALEASAFPLDEAVAFGLKLAADGANQMAGPIISAIAISGELNGSADFKLDAKDPTQSKGNAEITLGKALLRLDHPSLGLPNQSFKKAMFKAKVENGSVVLDKSSGFVSDELELVPDGKIILKPDALASQLDLTVMVKLNDGLKDRFGFMIDAFTGSSASDGQLTMRVRGPLTAPATTF